MYSTIFLLHLFVLDGTHLLSFRATPVIIDGASLFITQMKKKNWLAQCFKYS